MQKNIHNKKRGFVILFAVLASTLILAMAVSIFNVAYKEQILSGTTKASAYADAGANVGLECALYNDIKKHLFPDPNFPTGFPAGTPIPTPSTINCVGPDDWSVDASGTIYTFTIDTEDGYGIFVDNAPLGVHTNTNRPGCAKVFIDKNELGPGGEILTHIVSRGYNVACGQLQTLDNGTINPHIVERRSEVRYNSKGVTGPGGGNLPTSDIWATPFGGAPVGQGPGGGSISVENNGEGQYDVSWSSANVSSCTETVSPASFGFPQNTANTTSNTTINPGNDGVTPGTYVYTINCDDLSGNPIPPQSVTVVVFENSGGTPPDANIWVTGDSEASFDGNGNMSITLAQTPYTIHWNNPSGDANSCSVSVVGNDHVAWPQSSTSGTQTINVVSDMQGTVFTYTILCSNGSGSGSDSVNVTVAPSVIPSSARMFLYGRADGSSWTATSPGFPPPGGTGSPLGTSAYWQSNFGVFHILSNSFDVETVLGNVDLNSCSAGGVYHRWAMPDAPLEAGTAFDNATFVAYNGNHVYSFNLAPPTPGAIAELNLVCTGSLPPFSVVSKSIYIQLP